MGHPRSLRDFHRDRVRSYQRSLKRYQERIELLEAKSEFQPISLRLMIALTAFLLLATLAVMLLYLFA